MHPETLNHHLSKLSQEEIHNVLTAEVRNANSLLKRKMKAELAEREYSARKEGKSWALSEQYEKSKEAIRLIVDHLL